MIINTIPTTQCQPQTIVIGRRGTYDTMQIAFDLSYLVESYGNGVAVLAVKRSQDESAYPAIVTQEDATLLWIVNETDTAYVGSGECQLMWYVDGGLAKTIIYPMVVMRDILQTAEQPPDGYENWIEHLTELGAETQQNAQNAAQSASDAEQSATDAGAAKDAANEAVLHYPKIENGYWYVWDVTAQAYQNTNIKAEGDDGYSPEVTITSIEGGHRITITDKDHPQGQSFDVLDGQGGGGTSDYTDLTNKPQINGHTLDGNQTAEQLDLATPSDIPTDAGDIEYDESATYQAGSVGAELSDLTRQLSDLEENQINGIVNGYIVELGNIAIGNTGWIYSASSTRARLAEGSTVHLSKGTVIELTQNGYRYYLGWKRANNTYGSAGWLTSDYICQDEGDYVFLMSADPEATISDISVFENLLVLRDSSYLYNKIPSLVAKTGGSLRFWDAMYPLAYSTVDDRYVGSGLTRLAIASPMVLPEKTAVRVTDSVYQIAYIKRDSQGAFVSDTGWITGGVVLPANTPLTINFRKSDNSKIGADDIYNWIFTDADLNNSEVIENHKNRIRTIGNMATVYGVAHRGFAEMAPENTMPAFVLASKYRFRFIELDVRKTSDGKYVILHDETINRTARNADGTAISSTVNIEDITYEAAQAYDFGIWFGNGFAGTKIPTLEDVLSFSKRAGLSVYIELKLNFNAEECAEIVSIVGKCGMSKNVRYMSESTTVLNQINEIDQLAQITYLPRSQPSSSAFKTAIAAIKTDTNTVSCALKDTWVSSLMDTIAETGIEVTAWTVDDLVTAINLPACVSGVITNMLYNLELLYHLLATHEISNLKI